MAKIPNRVLAWTLGLSAVGSAALLIETSGRSQPPGPDTPEGKRVSQGAEGTASRPVPEVGHASERDEWRARAREDVSSLDAYLKAKKAQLREADLRLQVTKAHLGDLDRQLKRGVASTYVRMMGELSVVEAEADRETRLAELKDVETRRDRAIRRMARLDRGGEPIPLGLDSRSSGDRLSTLERETDRLRFEMDRTDQGLRSRFGVP